MIYWLLTTSSVYLSLISLCSAYFLQLAIQSATSSSSLAILVTAKLLLSSIYLGKKRVTFQLCVWIGRFPPPRWRCWQLTFLISPLYLARPFCRNRYSSSGVPFPTSSLSAFWSPSRICGGRVWVLLQSWARPILRRTVCSALRACGDRDRFCARGFRGGDRGHAYSSVHACDAWSGGHLRALRACWPVVFELQLLLPLIP